MKDAHAEKKKNKELMSIKNKGTWVQTERSAHEEWARYCIKKPSAAGVLHLLVSQMGKQNAVIISQKLIGEIMGITDRSVRTAIADLARENWIQVVRVGKGREAAYVVNSEVAWAESRSKIRFAIFSARVIADFQDQDEKTKNLKPGELKKLPVVMQGEKQLPAGPGSAGQMLIDGFEPDLPSLVDPDSE